MNQPETWPSPPPGPGSENPGQEGKSQPQSDPDPWPTGPLPGPGPALTAEEQADWEAYLDDCHSEGMRELDQRAEYEPGREPQLPVWLADWWARDRTAEAEAEAEAETEAEAEP